MRQTTRVLHPTHPAKHTLSAPASRPLHRLQDAARDYARDGWRILPLHGLSATGACTCDQLDCNEPGQHPRWCQLPQATTDLATIERWWQQDERANIGIATGNGLLVIDIDSRINAAFEHFCQLYAIPETAMLRTEHGNWQLYFTYNRTLQLRTTRDKLGLGIRTYGEGSYVVAPPSNTSSGQYRWHSSCAPVRLPAVLLPFVLSPRLVDPAWSTKEQQPSSAAHDLAQTLLQYPSSCFCKTNRCSR